MTKVLIGQDERTVVYAEDFDISVNNSGELNSINIARLFEEYSSIPVEIRFRDGVYDFVNTIKPKSDHTLIGIDTTLRFQDDFDEAIRFIHIESDSDGVRLEHLTIRTNDCDSCTDMIRVDGDDAFLSYLTLRDGLNDAIVVFGDRCRVVDCDINTDTNDNIQVQGDNALLQRNKVNDGSSGIYFLGTGTCLDFECSTHVRGLRTSTGGQALFNRGIIGAVEGVRFQTGESTLSNTITTAGARPLRLEAGKIVVSNCILNSYDNSFSAGNNNVFINIHAFPDSGADGLVTSSDNVSLTNFYVAVSGGGVGLDIGSTSDGVSITNSYLNASGTGVALVNNGTNTRVSCVQGASDL